MRISLVLLMLLCSIHAYTQSPLPSFKNFTVADGLPSSEVYDVIQDRVGYMWYATDRGVVKYNGYEFETFTTEDGLMDNVVFELYEDPKGRIWMIPMNGKLCFFEGNNIKEYQYNNELIEHLKVRHYQSFQVDKNDNIYVGTTLSGLLQISDKGIVTKTKRGMPCTNIFFGKRDGFVYSYQESNPVKCKKKIFNYHYDNVFVGNSTVSPIRSKGVLIKENLLCFNTAGKLILYNIDSAKIRSEAVFGSRVTSFEKIDGLLFVGLELGGLKVLVEQNGELIEKHHFLSNYTCTSIMKDKEGGYWFPTTQHGVFYTPNLDVLSYSVKNGLYENYIDELGVMGQKLAISYRDEYQIYAENSFSKLHLMNNTSMLIQTAYDSLRFYKKGCIFYYNGEKLMNTCENFVYPNLKSSSIPARKRFKGAIYFFNKREGYRYDEEKFTKISLSKEFSRIEDVEIIDEHTFWIGALTGLYKKTAKGIKAMSTVDSLFSYRVIGLDRTEKYELIVGTRGAGIILIQGDDIININTNNGLIVNDITSLYVDEEENIWVATNRGLNRIDANNIANIDFYSTNDGLISNEITNVRRIMNKVYVATKRGLSIIDLDAHKKTNMGVNTRIVSVKLNDELISHQSIIDISPNDKYLEINYLGINYAALGNIQYRYRIKEISNKWQYTKNRVLKLDIFPERGTYAIEIMARKLPDGVWSKKAKMITLKFHPPFYKTGWFLITALSLFFILIYIGFRIKVLAYNRHILQEIMSRLLKKLGKQSYLIIELDKKQIRINEADILFIQSFKDYVEIKTVSDKYLYRSTLKNMEGKLPSINFIRVHRSYLIQKDKVDGISKDELIIQNHQIPIGKTYQSKLSGLKNQFSRLNN